jgi:hypothetical protein
MKTLSNNRYLLVACGHIGGEFMKQIAAALFDAMRGCAITPNSITYGLYTKALAEENSRQVSADTKSDAPLRCQRQITASQ